MKSKINNMSGVWIALLGPDGCGKSSVIEQLKLRFNNAFSAVDVLHLRPHVKLSIKKDTVNVSVDDPHGQDARSSLSSVIKIMYFFFDYTVGYFIKVRPLLQKNKLVIFDRYYDDILVDPKRYRYGGKMWFARLIGHFIPKPNLMILLNAPADIIQGRKQEVSFDETERQTKAYYNLIHGMKDGVVINAVQPIDKVVSDIESAVMTYVECKKVDKVSE